MMPPENPMIIPWYSPINSHEFLWNPMKTHSIPLFVHFINPMTPSYLPGLLQVSQSARVMWCHRGSFAVEATAGPPCGMSWGNIPTQPFNGTPTAGWLISGHIITNPVRLRGIIPYFGPYFRVSELLIFGPDFMENPEENLTKQMDDCWGAILGKLCTTLQILNTIVLGASSPNIVIGV